MIADLNIHRSLMSNVLRCINTLYMSVGVVRKKLGIPRSHQSDNPRKIKGANFSDNPIGLITVF
jgi:hypothetical protein